MYPSQRHTVEHTGTFAVLINDAPENQNYRTRWEDGEASDCKDKAPKMGSSPPVIADR